MQCSAYLYINMEDSDTDEEDEISPTGMLID